MRAYRGPSSDGDSNRSSSGGGSDNRGDISRGNGGRGNNEQLQQMFKQYREQQAAGGRGDRGNNSNLGNVNAGGGNDPGNRMYGNRDSNNRGSFNRDTINRDDAVRQAGGEGGGNRGGRGNSVNRDNLNKWLQGDDKGSTASNQMRRYRGNNDSKVGGLPGGPGNDNTAGGRVNNGRGTRDNDGPKFGGTGNGSNDDRPNFGRGGNNGRPGDGQFTGGDRDGKGPGRGQLGDWSKKGNFDSKTARWYGNSGYGDHRNRGGWDGDRDGKHGGGPGRDGKWNGDGKWDGRGDWNGHGGKGNWNGNGKWDGKNHWNDRHDWGNHVRNDWNNNWSNKYGNRGWDWHRGRNWRDVPFAWGWWGGRNNWGNHCYWNGGWRNDPWYWWGWSTAPVLTSWVDYGWNVPCYWDYGPNEYITYYNNTVYVDNQRYATALEYYAQVRNLARSVPTLTQDQLANIEWLPLGVFAVTRSGGQQSNEMIQLAVSKDGILSGTWFDQATGQSRPIQGMVEQATQKAAWTFADSATDGLVMETSLFNLTEPECTAMAHLDAVTNEVWQLTRLQQPQQPAVAQPQRVAQPPAAAPAGAVNAPAVAAPVQAPAAGPVLPPQDAAK